MQHPDKDEEKPRLSNEAVNPVEIVEIEEKSLVRKIDLRLMPLLFVTYILQYLDKTSLNGASILGIIQDSELTGQMFPWLNSAFYFGYLVASYPVSILFVKLPIGKVLSASILMWSVVLGCHAACSNFVTLCTLRVLLGVCEATISPGFTLITGLWYKPSEHASRHGIWFLGNSVGGLCGSLIAFGCTFITGGPLAPWKWLFIILGVMTAIWSIVLLIWLPDSPSTASFLTPDQRVWATQRPQRDLRSFKTRKWSRQQFTETLIDPKTWLQFIIMTVTSLSNGVISNFTSLIIQGLGFDSRQTLLLGMPVAAFCLVTVIISIYLTRKFRKSRLIIATGGQIIALMGALLLRQLPNANKGGRFAGVVLFTACVNIFPILLSLISSNVGGFTKKASVNAIFFLGYCTGNIAGPQFFKPAEAPNYDTAFTALIAIFCIVSMLLITLRQYLVWENRRRDKIQGVHIDIELPQADLPSTTGVVDETDWGNKNFRYHL